MIPGALDFLVEERLGGGGVGDCPLVVVVGFADELSEGLAFRGEPQAVDFSGCGRGDRSGSNGVLDRGSMIACQWILVQGEIERR